MDALAKFAEEMDKVKLSSQGGIVGNFLTFIPSAAVIGQVLQANAITHHLNWFLNLVHCMRSGSQGWILLASIGTQRLRPNGGKKNPAYWTYEKIKLDNLIQKNASAEATGNIIVTLAKVGSDLFMPIAMRPPIRVGKKRALAGAAPGKNFLLFIQSLLLGAERFVVG
jgi:hypothetical protein